MKQQRAPLLALVFVAGMSGMAVEMAGSRLLAPYFGNSLIVWANLIGLIMLYLTVGYYLGGRLADRFPRATILFRLTTVAALAIALVPWGSRPILRYAATGFAGFRWGLVVSSFIGVVALFAAPMILLGCVSPFAIRLDLRGLHATGRVAGGIYGLSTLGSILGTFTPVFVLIPTIGTRRTFLLFALVLSIVSFWGLWQAMGRKAWWYVLVPLLILALWFVGPAGPVKPSEGLVYEGESAYNYIQVLRQGDAYLLKLNEGEGNQSVYIPGQVLLHRIFDYFLAAPLFRPRESAFDLGRVCIVGLAGGTIAQQYTAVYGPIPIDGVELDPRIVAVARKYFGMHAPNLAVHVQDGRRFLRQTERDYDVIVVDAYRPPYIPFHLTTQEFFAEARRHLTGQGVVAVNVARTEDDYALVDAIASTMVAVFPTVMVVDAPESYNSMVVGTRQPVTRDDFQAQAARVAEPMLQDVVRRTSENLREYPIAIVSPLRDDRAPVEQIIHNMIWRFVWQG